jgi:hypothetical protein
MQRLAAAVAKGAGPPSSRTSRSAATGVKSPCDDGTPARACGADDPGFTEIHGRFSVPIFQKGRGAVRDAVDGAGGIVEEGGVPKVQRTEDVCFALSVPKGDRRRRAGRSWSPTTGRAGSMRSFINDGIAAKMSARAKTRVGRVRVRRRSSTARGAAPSTKKPDDLVFNPLKPARGARQLPARGPPTFLQAFRIAEQGGFALARQEHDRLRAPR